MLKSDGPKNSLPNNETNGQEFTVTRSGSSLMLRILASYGKFFLATTNDAEA
jgi:hypothetical protein